jgi:hypothetical protein
MNRSNPNFKAQTLFSEDTESFLDELFSNLFDDDDISENTDKIPDLGTFDRAA